MMYDSIMDILQIKLNDNFTEELSGKKYINVSRFAKYLKKTGRKRIYVLKLK